MLFQMRILSIGQSKGIRNVIILGRNKEKTLNHTFLGEARKVMNELQHRFYAMMPSLERLLDIENLQIFFQKSGMEMKDSLSQGYGFLVASQITRLIEWCVENPSSIGMEENLLLCRAFFVGLPFHRLPCDSRLGRFVRNLYELCRALIGVSSWTQMKKVSMQVNELLLKPMKIAFDYATDIEISGVQKEKFTEIKLKILEDASLSLFKMFDHDIIDIKIAFNHTYKKDSSEFVQSIKLPTKLGKQEFFEGYKVGVMYLWFSFRGPRYFRSDIFRKIRGTENWEALEEFFDKMGEERYDDFDKIEQLDRIFKLPSAIERNFPKHIFKKMTDSTLFKQGKKTKSERLDEALMYYSIHMLHVHNEIQAFTVLLKGYTSINEGVTKVIKFVHRQEPGNNFSFAILMESFGLISDFSSWVLLYDFATDYSGNGGTAYNYTMNTIRSLGKKVSVTDFEVGEGELKSYAEESKMHTLETHLRQTDKSNEKLRSQLLELTAVYVLSRMGFAVHWGYSRSDVLRGKEIDALSIREGTHSVNVLVVEITETLPLEIDRFKREIQEKIELIRRGWREVASDFHLAETGKKALNIVGWVITRETRGRRKLTKNIYVKDLDCLREFCKNQRIPYRSSLVLGKDVAAQDGKRRFAEK